ncbi:MAG: adenosine kinase [Candidatus Micrarchaeota archaeon]|nr:adenosine kinase [Candidatus Micrarchaeota archaeon]
MTLDVCVIGDTFFDIVIKMTNSYIAGGSYTPEMKFSAGGLANVAVWAARNGAETAFCGYVGRDALGKAYEEDIHNEKVEPYILVAKNERTGLCVSLSSGAERTMFVRRGANDSLSIDEIMKRIPDAKFYYFAGYSFGNRETGKKVKEIIRTLHEKNARIIFNIGASNLVSENESDFVDIAHMSDILIMNEDEAMSFAKKENLSEVIDELKSINVKFIITRGEKGSVSFDGKNEYAIEVKRVENVIDTTGAGDAFAGGFLAGISKGIEFKDAIALGHETAAKAIERMGAR